MIQMIQDDSIPKNNEPWALVSSTNGKTKRWISKKDLL